MTLEIFLHLNNIRGYVQRKHASNAATASAARSGSDGEVTFNMAIPAR